jgi:hypothetical protein
MWEYHVRMARGGHGIPKVSPGPAISYPYSYTPYVRATPEKVVRPSPTPLDTPYRTPMIAAEKRIWDWFWNVSLAQILFRGLKTRHKILFPLSMRKLVSLTSSHSHSNHNTYPYLPPPPPFHPLPLAFKGYYEKGRRQKKGEREEPASKNAKSIPSNLV